MVERAASIHCEPVSAAVGVARRFVTGWAHESGLGGVADDAGLVVSELAANAVLHARTDFEVRVRELPGGLRVELHDGSTTLPLSGVLGTGATSGRGLPLVHALATHWGVDPLASTGKSVWAEIVQGQEAEDDDVTADELLEMWAAFDEAPGAAAAPAGTVLVTVPALPVGELLAAESHVEDLVRELQLVRLDHGARRDDHRAAEARVAERMDAAAREVESLRLQIRGQALQAAERGDEHVVLELLLPPSAAEAATRYCQAVDEAQQLSLSGQLLSRGDALTRYAGIRRQYLDAIVRQVSPATA